MKKPFLIIALLFSSIAFSQISIPEKSEYGKITTTTGAVIWYKNLEYKNGKVSYIDTNSGSQEFLYDNSIKSIEITEQKRASISEGISEVLKDLPDYKKDPDYIRGKKTGNWGTGFLIGGGLIFIGGGINNLSKANNTNNMSNNSKSGTPLPLIIGLGAIATGVIMKIDGGSTKKKAKQKYLTENSVQKEYSIVTNGNGVGLQIKF